MIKRIPWKWVGIGLFLVVAAALLFLFWPQSIHLEHLAEAGASYQVRILRDEWGVPHIFGETDPDVAYGLGYAHSEDDFLTIQQSLLAARGELATVYGPDAAANDYMVHMLRVWDVVANQYESDLTPDTRAILDAYANGLNHYAALHPEEVLGLNVFPVSGRDLAAASVHKSPLFFGLERTLGELFQETRDQAISPRLEAPSSMTEMGQGSNTFSIGPGRTPDNATYLAVNSHQPWEGAVTWYEAHLHSEEGWDMTGALFPGSPVIIHGHNRHLGWAFTVNNADLVDVYVLTINPENQNQYLFDGEWRELEVRDAPIRVKLLGRLSWVFREEVFWSVFGPVIRQDHGTYAIRYGGSGRVDIWQQLYRMNKASHFQEWQEAVKSQALPTFNIGYADGEGNIYYLYNASIPLRAENYDWSLDLPGDNSEVLWTEYLPFEQLPQVLNPPSNLVQNCNSSPFQTTLGPGNPDPGDYSVTLGIEDPMTNRALRALELFGGDESITFEEFITYKYDMTYSTRSELARYREMILAAPSPQELELQQAVEIVAAWDLRADPENTGAALMILTWHYLDEAGKTVDTATGSDLMESLGQAAELLRQEFGRLDLPWSEVNRLQRGELDLGLGGGPDLLHAVYGRLGEDGRLVGRQGDSYVLLAAWDAQGRVHSFSIHQYGSATQDENSPHYADQAPLFVQRQLKPVLLDEADIQANLEQEYRPGEEDQ